LSNQLYIAICLQSQANRLDAVKTVLNALVYRVEAITEAACPDHWFTRLERVEEREPGIYD